MSYTSHDIEKYIKGELTPAERYALERMALSDPFLADALEGAEQINPSGFLEDVAGLKQKISTRKVWPWMWTARIAAALALIAASTFVIVTLNQDKSKQELALQTDQPKDTAVSKDQAPEIPNEPSTPTEKTLEPTPAKRDTDVAGRAASSKKTKLTLDQAPEPKDDQFVAEAVEEKKSEEGPDADAEKAAPPVTVAKAEDDRRKLKVSEKGTDKQVGAVKGFVYADSINNASALASTVVKGKVTSADGSAVPGVNINIKGSSYGTVTDEYGNYQIAVDNTNTSLEYSYIGLRRTEVPVNNRNEINVQMAPDATQLSEVVIKGDTPARSVVSPKVELAHPDGGSRAFKQYLEKNLRYPSEATDKKVEGRVTVEFVVEADGTLSDFVVVRGIGSGCDEELIRLIKEGPKWLPTKYGNIAVQDKAQVRLNFELP